MSATTPISTITVDADGLSMTCLTAGDDGPLALCLHGFPDTAWGWRYLLPALANAGYRAVAPFMRGYAPTAVPADGQYFVAALAHDAIALHGALGGDGDAVLIGHDWGALATYAAANARPELWRRVVTAAVPPPGAMASAMTTYDQLKRSWYMFFFQVALADWVVGTDDLAFIARLWEDWSPGYDATVDMAHVRDALGDPAHLAAALGYYRATWGTDAPAPKYAALQGLQAGAPPQPTLYLHGADDGCIGAEFASGVASELSPGSASMVLDGCGHFLQVERPDDVNLRIIEFLAD